MIAWEMDAETRRFTRVSGGAQAVLGYPAERWQGVPGFWIGVLHPDDRERVARAVWRALRERQPCEIEYRAVASDGSIVRLRDRVRVVRDATGTLLLQGSIIDLTERLAPPRPTRRKRGRRWRRYPYDLRSAPLVPMGPSIDRLGDPTLDAPPADWREADSPPAEPVAERVEPPAEPAPLPAAEPPARPAEPEWSPAVLDSTIFPFDGEPVEPVRPESAAGTDVAGPDDSTPAAAIPDSWILRAIGEAVIASDADHRIVYWNAAAEALLGWTATDAIGRIDAELIAARAPAGQNSAILRGLVDRRPWMAEVEVRTKVGTLVPVRVTASALRSHGDRIAGFVAVVSDLRDARAADARRSAAASMDAVARLARGIGEELKSGVSRVEASVRAALARIPAADPSRASLDESLLGIDAAAALAAQLLAVGRAVPVRRTRIDLQAALGRSRSAVELLAGPGLELTWRPPADVPPIDVDPSMISQILLNLVANSSAALDGDGRISIGVRSEVLDAASAWQTSPRLDAGEWVVLDVTDSRSSTPSSIETFFEPFNDPARAGPTGMGLAAAHGLVAACDGVLIADVPAAGGFSMQAWFRPASD